MSGKVVRLATCAMPAHTFDSAVILEVEIALLFPIRISGGRNVWSLASFPAQP